MADAYEVDDLDDDWQDILTEIDARLLQVRPGPAVPTCASMYES